MSPCHFARMFKKATGQPPHAYITTRRMEYAKELLRESDSSLVDVAAKAGFQTQGHFTGVFHRYTGVTPRVYRLQLPGSALPERRRPSMRNERAYGACVAIMRRAVTGESDEAQ